MAKSSGKALVQWMVAVLLIALLGCAQATVLCNIDSSQLKLCRAAVTGQNPPPPDERCCAVIRHADLHCLCTYEYLLPSLGINPTDALALPGKCGLKTPPLVQLMVAVLFIALLGGAQAAVLCNIDSGRLSLCRAAVTGPSPPPPDARCCAVLRRANLQCLCTYKYMLITVGIKPANALVLPSECGLRAPPSCL